MREGAHPGQNVAYPAHLKFPKAIVAAATAFAEPCATYNGGRDDPRVRA